MVLGGCGGCGESSDIAEDESGIRPAAPEAIAPESRGQTSRESVLYVPIEIPTQEVSALVNRAVPDSLFRAREMEVSTGLIAVKVDLDVYRNGDIETYSAYGSVFNRIPLAASGRVGLPQGVWRPFDSQFFVNTTTDLSLTDAWRTESATHAAITWVEEPSISIAGIQIGLGGPAESAMQGTLDDLMPLIDRIIEKEVNLRREVDKIWEDLAEPIFVSEQPPLWLSIKPDSASYRAPRTVGDTVLVELLVDAEIETVVGSEPPAKEPVRGLPPLREMTDESAGPSAYGFSVYLPVRLGFAEAASIAEDRLSRDSLELENGVILNLSGIELYGRDDVIVAKVDFRASLTETTVETEGTVYFTGRPAYDSLLQEIRVEDFDFDVESRNALAAAAEWILKGAFREKLQDRLRIPIGDQIEIGRSALEDALRVRPIGKHIIVSGTVDQLEPGSIFLIKDGIEVELFASGRLEARVGALEQAIKKVPQLVQ